jgi:hypothetical protein
LDFLRYAFRECCHCGPCDPGAIVSGGKKGTQPLPRERLSMAPQAQ